MLTRPPCYDETTRTDCPRRYVGCRAECTKWHDWLAIHESEREVTRRNKRNESDVQAFLAGQTRRAAAGEAARRGREKRRRDG